MSKLVGRGIVKTYGKKTVLQDVNLMLEEHKIYGMIGRNGAGKTTLLSILTAQNPATKGEILWNGIPVWENKEALSHICFSRELNQVSGNNMNALRIKDYLQAAEAFLPHWDKQMADFTREAVSAGSEEADQQAFQRNALDGDDHCGAGEQGRFYNP